MSDGWTTVVQNFVVGRQGWVRDPHGPSTYFSDPGRPEPHVVEDSGEESGLRSGGSDRWVCGQSPG